jgi:hypothetical protein
MAAVFKVMIISLWNLLQYHSIVRWAIQLDIVLSVLHQCTASDCPFFGHCIVCPTSIYGLWLSFFGHCIVCPSSIYGLWLYFWYLQTFLNSILFDG